MLMPSLGLVLVSDVSFSEVGMWLSKCNSIVLNYMLKNLLKTKTN